MSITPKNLVRHELIGLDVKIDKAANPEQKGMKGKVIDESYNTITLETAGDNEKTIVKKDCIFIFKLPDKTKVMVDGKLLVSRPEDRIKKKFERW